MKNEDKKNDPKRRKLRRRIVAAVLVVCVFIDVLYYSVRKSEAAIPLLAGVGSVLYGFISSETVWSTIMLAGVAAGIYNTTEEIVEEGNEAYLEQQEALYYDYGVNQQELMMMLVNGGYFDSPELAAVLTAAYENAAVDATLYQQMCEALSISPDVLTPRDPDDENTATTLAFTAAALGTISVQIRNAFMNWVEDKKEEMKEVSGLGGTADIVLPEELPEGYDSQFGYTGYIVFEHYSGEIFLYSLKNCNWEAQLYDNTRKRILFLGYKQYKINESNEWVLKDEWKASTWGSFCIGSGETISKILYNSNAITGALNIPAKPYKGGVYSEGTSLEDIANAYMGVVGLTTRFSQEFADASSDIFSDENTGSSIDDLEVDTNKLLVIDDWAEIIKDTVHPISTLVNSVAGSQAIDATLEDALDDIKAAVKEGCQAVTDAVEGTITKEDAPTLSVIPYTPNLGPSDKYIVDGLEDVFPFCIPFDLARCIEVMVAEPEAPYIEFPFVFESIGINEVIVLDMSRFEAVASISRWIESIMFAYGLITKTKSVMSW